MKVAFFPGSFKPPHIGHYTLVKELLPKVDRLYILISSKSRDGIQAKESKKIWEIYLSSNNRKKIQIVVTNKSPILEVFKILREGRWTSEDTIYLIKSSKNSKNKRFDLFKRLKLNIKEKVLPKFSTISSTNMRQALQNKDFKTFQNFLPLHLTKKKEETIYKMLL